MYKHNRHQPLINYASHLHRQKQKQNKKEQKIRIQKPYKR